MIELINKLKIIILLVWKDSEHTDPFIQFSCTKSHLAIFKYCSDNNIESVLILEDDFQIYDECKFVNKYIPTIECLDKLVDDMKNVDWDVIMLSAIQKHI
jgi:hypothetical protein